MVGDDEEEIQLPNACRATLPQPGALRSLSGGVGGAARPAKADAPSEYPALWDLGAGAGADIPAQLVLRAVVPDHSRAVRARLQRERVFTAADLAGLDQEDLQALGFTMVERSRVLSWARRAFSAAPLAGTGVLKESLSMPAGAKVFSPLLLNMTSRPQFQRLVSDQSDSLSALDLPDDASSEEESRAQRLDRVESKADFWCRLVSDLDHKSFLGSDFESMKELLRTGSAACLSDLRENILEKLFDLSPERLKDVYESIDRDSDGRILKEELLEGLHRCEIHGLDGMVEKVLKMVSRDSKSMRLDEFESALTRLKLAQLLTVSKYQYLSVAEHLIISDYNSYKVENRNMSLQDFFFGHRCKDLPMRWVHLRQFDLVLLLAIMVKYQLHPLSVEDVIDQAPTKIDRYDGHYFISIEHLEVAGAVNGFEPVRVCGRHVTLFCAGPPHLDTVITACQAERSFQQDWPGQVPPVPLGQKEDLWVGRLHRRLQAARSRVRERQANFLMYEILDLCADDFRLVTRVYSKRLNWLEERLTRSKISSEQGKLEWYSEVGIVRLQLAVVARRLRGLQHILRRLAEDPDVAQLLSGYLQDVADHINEAYEDARHLSDKCLNLSAAYEHARDRAQEEIQRQAERVRNLKDERMNKMLFVLTVFTSVFTPLTFIAGVYGMNFQDKDGTPTIPELLYPHGYDVFLMFTLVYLVVGGVGGVWLWKWVRRGTGKDQFFSSGDGMVSP